MQGFPCHHRAQGSLVNPFGYPPLSDIGPASGIYDGVCRGYIGDISGVYSVYIPLSLIPEQGGPIIRERGIPERINRTALDAMMAPGPLRDAIVSLLLLFPRRPPPPSSGGIGSAGPGEKNVGG